MTLIKSSFLVLLMLSICHKAAGYDRVLFLGDSHSYGPYGTVLDSYFRTKAEHVVSIASCGSSPSTWTSVKANFKSTNCGYWKKERADGEIRVKSQKLESFSTLLENVKPDLAVISMGTNILSSQDNIERELKNIEKMLNQIKVAGANCIWLGPPDLKKNPFKENLNRGVERIQEVVRKKGCHFVDSTRLTKYPNGKSDGIHYKPADSKKWGESVRLEIDKIKLDTSSTISGAEGSRTSAPAKGAR